MSMPDAPKPVLPVNVFRKAIPAVLVAVVLAGVVFIVGISQSDDSEMAAWAWPVVTMGAVLGFTVLMLTLAGGAVQRGQKADVRRVLEGEHWAVWQYTADEWRRFVDTERQKMEAQLGKSAKRYAKLVDQEIVKLMRVPTPRIYFIADGLYDDNRGYTSLRRLKDAANHPDSSPPTLVIESWQRSGKTTVLSKLVIPVPQGKEMEASVLVQRYQQG